MRRQVRSLLLGRDARLRQHEFVTPRPRQKIVRAEQGGEALDDLLQQPVADRVAVDVINVFEIVHVQTEQGRVFSGRLARDCFLEDARKIRLG